MVNRDVLHVFILGPTWKISYWMLFLLCTIIRLLSTILIVDITTNAHYLVPRIQARKFHIPNVYAVNFLNAGKYSFSVNTWICANHEIGAIFFSTYTYQCLCQIIVFEWWYIFLSQIPEAHITWFMHTGIRRTSNSYTFLPRGAIVGSKCSRTLHAPCVPWRNSNHEDVERR